MTAGLLGAEILGFDTNSIWWGICRGLYYILNGIEQAYFILAGIQPISNSGQSGGELKNMTGNLVSDLMNGVGVMSMSASLHSITRTSITITGCCSGKQTESVSGVLS